MVRPDGDYPISYPPLLSVLGKDREQQWREKAHEQVTRATNSLADRDTFGGTPAARKFASVYTAALTEYTAALKGAQDDLVTAAENLARAAEEIRSRDEDAGAAFVSLLARWTDPEGFESNRRQEEARGSDAAQEGATTMAGLTEDDTRGQGPGQHGDGTGPGGADGGQPSGGAADPSATMATGPTGNTPPGPGPDGVA